MIGSSGGVSHSGARKFGSVMGAILGAVRIVLIVAALLAGGWLATQVRAARAENELTKIAFENGRGGQRRAAVGGPAPQPRHARPTSSRA